MRDVAEFLRGLLTFIGNPFLTRGLRRELRDRRLLTFVTVALTASLAVAFLVMAQVTEHVLRLRVAAGEVLAIGFLGVFAWFLIATVRHRARETLEQEAVLGSLDLLLLCSYSPVRIVGMKATHPFLFGLAFLCLSLPVLMAAATLGGFEARDFLALAALAGVGGASVMGTLGRRLGMGRLRVPGGRAQIARAIASGMVLLVLGQCLLAPLLFGRSAALAALSLPMSWPLLLARLLLRPVTFFGHETPLWWLLAPVLPFAWGAAARSVANRVSRPEPAPLIRSNPCAVVTDFLVSLGAMGLLWRWALESGYIAGWVGGAPNDVAATAVGMGGVYLAAWATLVGASSLTGRSFMSWVPGAHQGDTAPNKVVNAEFRSLVGMVPPLAVPCAAVLIVIAATGARPSPALWATAGRAVVACGAALLLWHSFGRLPGLLGKGDRSRTGNLAAVPFLLATLGTLGLFDVSRIPAQLAPLSPIAGFLTAWPDLRESVLSQQGVPDFWAIVAQQGFLALALTGVTASAAAAARSRADRRRSAYTGRSAAELMDESDRRLRGIHNPIAVRLLRSPAYSVLRLGAIALPVVLCAAGAVLAVLYPGQMAEFGMDAGWVASGSSPLGAALMTVGVVVMGLVALYMGVFAAVGGANKGFVVERERGTAGPVLISPLSDAQIAMAYVLPAWYLALWAAAVVVPYALLGALLTASGMNIATVIVLAIAAGLDIVACGAFGALIGLLHKGSWQQILATLVFGADRMVVILYFTISTSMELAMGAQGMLVQTAVLHGVMLAHIALIPIVAAFAFARVEGLRRHDIPFAEEQEPDRWKATI